MLGPAFFSVVLQGGFPSVPFGFFLVSSVHFSPSSSYTCERGLLWLFTFISPVIGRDIIIHSVVESCFSFLSNYRSIPLRLLFDLRDHGATSFTLFLGFVFVCHCQGVFSSYTSVLVFILVQPVWRDVFYLALPRSYSSVPSVSFSPLPFFILWSLPRQVTLRKLYLLLRLFHPLTPNPHTKRNGTIHKSLKRKMSTLLFFNRLILFFFASCKRIMLHNFIKCVHALIWNSLHLKYETKS